MTNHLTGSLTRQGVLLIAGSLALGTALAACSPSDDNSSSGGKTEITFSYLWGGKEGATLEEIIKDYNASQDKVVVKGISSPDTTKQLASMSSSQGSFDISDNFGQNTAAWAAKGILAPLDGVDQSQFVPVTLPQLTYDDKLYAVPIAVHSMELMYNKDLLAEAGVTPPKTMDELAVAIEKLTKVDSAGNITQLGLGVTAPDGLYTTLGYAFGGSWDDGAKPTPDEKANVAAMDWYQQNVVKKFGADKLAKFQGGIGQYMSAEDPFYTGKFAMTLDGEWQSAAIAKTAPNLNWGVVPVPAASPELANSTYVTISTLFIPSNSKHKEEAQDFLNYLVSKPVMEKFSLALGNLPSRTDLLDSDAYSSLPNIDVWMDGLGSDNAKSQGALVSQAEYSADLATAFDEIGRGVKTGDQALAKVADKAKNYAD